MEKSTVLKEFFLLFRQSRDVFFCFGILNSHRFRGYTATETNVNPVF